MARRRKAARCLPAYPTTRALSGRQLEPAPGPRGVEVREMMPSDAAARTVAFPRAAHGSRSLLSSRGLQRSRSTAVCGRLSMAVPRRSVPGRSSEALPNQRRRRVLVMALDKNRHLPSTCCQIGDMLPGPNSVRQSRQCPPCKPRAGAKGISPGTSANQQPPRSCQKRLGRHGPSCLRNQPAPNRQVQQEQSRRSRKAQ